MSTRSAAMNDIVFADFDVDRLELVPIERPLAGAGAVFRGACALAPPQPATRPDVYGPGWFESSFELLRGLDVREVHDETARLRDWMRELLH